MKCPVCKGRGLVRRNPGSLWWYPCIPCRATGIVIIITRAAYELETDWMSIQQAKRVIEEKRKKKLDTSEDRADGRP